MSPIPQMEGLDHRIHAGFGRHLAGARAFHFKSLSICVICVICGFNSLLQDESAPPLLRGIGTLVVLAAAVVSFVIARLNDPKQSAKPSSPVALVTPAQNGRIDNLADQMEDLREEMNEATVVDDVLENVWFECLGFSGTALIATSFLVEWRVRRAKLAVPAAEESKDQEEAPPSSAPEKAGP